MASNQEISSDVESPSSQVEWTTLKELIDTYIQSDDASLLMELLKRQMNDSFSIMKIFPKDCPVCDQRFSNCSNRNRHILDRTCRLIKIVTHKEEIKRKRALWFASMEIRKEKEKAEQERKRYVG